MGPFMVFNATFNNISVISCQSVLLVKETRNITDLPQNTDKLYHIMLYRVHLAMSEVLTHNFSHECGIDRDVMCISVFNIFSGS